MWDDHSHLDALFIQEGIMLKRNVLNYPALWRGNDLYFFADTPLYSSIL